MLFVSRVANTCSFSQKDISGDTEDESDDDRQSDVSLLSF
jgi:hypothetical protein